MEMRRRNILWIIYCGSPAGGGGSWRPFGGFLMEHDDDAACLFLSNIKGRLRLADGKSLVQGFRVSVTEHPEEVPVIWHTVSAVG